MYYIENARLESVQCKKALILYRHYIAKIYDADKHTHMVTIAWVCNETLYTERKTW